MYWLGTSRWGCSPLCTLHSICVCFFLAFRPFLLLFRCLVLLCVLACVYPLWHGGFLGSCFLPFIPSWARYCPDESHCLDSLLGPHLVVVGLLAINLPYCFIVFATALSCLYFSLLPWAYWLVFLSYKPIDPLILSFGLPQPIYYIFTSYHSLWACWSLFLPCQPIVFTTLFLGLPQSIYFFFTSSYSHWFIA